LEKYRERLNEILSPGAAYIVEKSPSVKYEGTIATETFVLIP
jgi:hypothetical protein